MRHKKREEVKKRLGTPYKNAFKYEYETVHTQKKPTVTKQSEKKAHPTEIKKKKRKQNRFDRKVRS